MKIQKITFQNIQSLKGTTHIDFTSEPLHSSGLFAITGPTGAGKTTILDAITLALFNQTPRLGQISPSKVSSIGALMTKNTFEAFAEVEYSVKEQVYRSKWSIHRSKRSGEPQPYTMEIAQLPGDMLFDLKNNQVPDKNAELLGLNYQQFVKSILLSQGEFAIFLKANTNERGELLEKLTGTHMYRELGKAAFEKRKLEKDALDKLELSLQHIKLLSKDEIEQLASQQNEFTEKNKLWSSRIAELSNELQRKKQLQQLTSEIKLLKKTIEGTEQKMELHKVELRKLEKHNNVIKYKPDIHLINTQQEQLNDLQKQLTEKNKQQNTYIKSVEELTGKESNVKDKTNRAQNEIEKMRPTIGAVKVLDKEIGFLVEKQKNESQNLNSAKKALKETEESLKEIIGAMKKYGLRKKELETWLTENKNLADLKNSYFRIEDKASTIKTLTNEIKNNLKRANRPELSSLFKKSTQWADKEHDFELEISELLKKKKGLKSQTTYETHELPLLVQHIADLREVYSTFSNLLKICKTYQNKLKLINETGQAIKSSNDTIKHAETQLKPLQERLEITQMAMKELTARFERQLLEEKYSGDREKLRKDEPCFLCGSTMHPYVNNYVNRKSATKKQLEKSEDDLQKINAEIQSLEKIISTENYNTKSSENRLKELQEENNNLFLEFTELAKLIDAEISIERPAEIEQKRLEIEQKGIHLKKEQGILEDISKIETLHKIIEQFYKDIKQINQLNKEFVSSISPFISANGQNQPIGKILNQLSGLQNKYAEQEKEMEETEKELLLKQNSKEEKEMYVLQQQSQLKELQTRYTEISSIAHKKKDERKGLLGDKKTEDIEKENNMLLNNLKDELNKTQILIVEKETALKSAREQSEQLSKNVADLTSKHTESVTNLHLSLIEHQINSVQEAESMLLGEEECKAIQTRQQELHEQLLTTNQSLKNAIENNDKLKKELTNTLEIPELKSEIDELEKTRNELNKKIGSIETLLATDKKKQDEASELMKNLEKQKTEYTRWDHLSELIGDATGTKFNKFAQELTLEHLIFLANRHIRRLTDRYLIVKEDNNTKENLFVIDTYLGNTRRSVSTLSGGESFLASLALALGLADLASKNTKIDSLFIDEGFGTLDDETLDLALTTLERLQAETNRTIGIISHIQALKDRLPTQIEIIRESGGFGKVHILRK